MSMVWSWNHEVIRRSGAAAERDRTRTLDAVHLASLLELVERSGEPIPLVAADGPPLRAAAAGVRVIQTG
jgi:hypothetical protein